MLGQQVSEQFGELMTHIVLPRLAEKTRGFTLTEIAIVLGIVGIILGAIWAAAGTVYSNNRTKEASTEVLTIIGNWQSVYGGRRVDIGDWTDITAATITNKFMPSQMVQSTVPSQGFSPWNGYVFVYSVQSWNAIAVQYGTLSQSACSNFANALAMGTNSQLVDVYISGQEWTFPPIGTSVYLKSTDVSTACQPGDGNVVRLAYSMQ